MTADSGIYVYCGVYESGHAQSEQTSSFWPVLQAVINSSEIMVREDFNESYALIFSSKTAIDFFYAEIFQKNANILKNCRAVYCVGLSSKQHFERILGNFVHIAVLAPKNAGMQNTIDEFHLAESNERLVFVTAAEGRSRTVVESIAFKSHVLLIPIYRLIPYKSDFLQQFQQVYENRQTITFECRSGRILAQAVQFLMEYFSSDDILGLPENIHFSCFGQSTLDRINQFYGQQNAQTTH